MTPEVRAQAEAFDATLPATGLSAALDPHLVERAGAAVGEVVRVTSDSGVTVAVRLTSDVTVEAGSGRLRLDTLSRRVLGVRLGSDTTVSSCDVATASQVGIEVDERVVPGDASPLTERLRGELAAVPLTTGMVLCLPAGPEGSLVTLRVAELDGPGVVQLGADTGLHVAAADLTEFVRPNNGGLDEVGGNQDAVAQLREVIQLAISHPGIYARLGIKPSRGVILHGPPGTGKSLMCRSLAGELDAAFYYISGPEVVGSLHGQTEESLRAVFSDAVDHSPAIICIDEVDALTRNRRALSNQADMRAVAQLLALMDGLRRAPGVFVVGTTNQVDMIDPAFRRPGRFDREIEISEPDETARMEILNVHTASMPLSAKARATLGDLALETVGFTGADLWALTQRAALLALRRVAQDGGLSQAQSALAASETIGVEDLRTAAGEIEPASVRDGHFVIPRPQPLVGKSPALDRLRDIASAAVGPVGGSSGGAIGTGVLLTGAHGAGKSAVVDTIASEFDLRLVMIDGPELASRWLGDTEQAVRHLTNLARRMRPSLLLLDNVEAMAPRGRGGFHDAGDVRLVGQLAAAVSDLAQADGVLVVGTSARPDLIDDLLLGASGLRLRIDVHLPDVEDRRAILATLLPVAELSRGRLDALAEQSAGLTPADLRTATSLAHSRWARSTDGPSEGAGLAGLVAAELHEMAHLQSLETTQTGDPHAHTT